MVLQLSKTLPTFNKNIGFNSSKATNGFSSDSIFSTQELTQFILTNFVRTKDPQDLPINHKKTCYVISYYDKFIYAGMTIYLRSRIMRHQWDFKNNGIDTSKLRYYYLCPHSNMLDHCNAEILEAQLILAIKPMLNKNTSRSSNILNALTTKSFHQFEIGETYQNLSGNTKVTILGIGIEKPHLILGFGNPYVGAGDLKTLFYIHCGHPHAQSSHVGRQNDTETILTFHDEHEDRKITMIAATNKVIY